MSHLRAISSRIRATIAVLAVWAMVFGMASSGAAAANATDLVYKNNAFSGGLFACFKRHMTQHGDFANEKAPDHNSSKGHHCPCCLAAHAAAALLPERVPAIARPASPAWAPISYRAVSNRAPENFLSQTANGARAPPLTV